MTEQEVERTFLAKFLPSGLEQHPYVEIADTYLPPDSSDPVLRLRKQGETYQITKKTMLNPPDRSYHLEQSITLNAEEFQAFALVEGKKLRKYRYTYNYNGQKTEIDVFQDALYGLVLIDIEFSSFDAQNNLVIPDFCLVDVTQNRCFAGGILAGKAYEDIEGELARLHYHAILPGE